MSEIEMAVLIGDRIAERIERHFSVMPTLTLADAAKELGLSQQTVAGLCDSGRLPHLRVGKFYRIKPGDINDYLDSCKVVGAEEEPHGAEKQ